MSTTAPPASTAEALGMLRAAAGFLAAADAAAMAAGEQAECLRALEQAHSMTTAARASVLSAFTAAKGYTEDGAYGSRSWLIHQTRITACAATAHTAWSRRAAAHPRIAEVLAAGLVSESYARALCEWTGKLSEDCQDKADAILAGAARGGATLADLLALAAEIYARSLPPDDGGPDETFEDRSLRLDTTIDGAGVLRGDLTPECAAVVTAVLDALSAPAGAEDTRSHEQRYHDGLAEAMRRLAAAGLLPERAGQPVKALVHVTLAELCAMDGGSVLQDQWIADVQARWGARRAAGSVTGSDGGAWLDGAAAHALTCDAILTPVVTGDVDLDALDDLVRLCAELGRHEEPDRSAPPGTDPTGPPASGPPSAAALAREALQQAIIGKAIDLLSGPGGLASFLRRQQLGARLAGPSLPLDIGVSSTIPAGIRAAVILRDQHCQWAGGCDQPAAACEVHHLTHKANGGKTSVRDCGLYCSFHHQVAIHRWGWTVAMNPDGTTIARSPDGNTVFRSHGPPAD